MQENPRPDEADEGEPQQPDQGMPLLDDVPQQPTTGEPRVPPRESVDDAAAGAQAESPAGTRVRVLGGDEK